MHRKLLWGSVIGAAALILALVAVFLRGDSLHAVKQQGCAITAYASTELGSPESFEELNDVKALGLDGVTAYGSMNGRTMEATLRYLDVAEQMGLCVEFSVKDVLGATDTDKYNTAHHRKLFGVEGDRSTDMQVTTVVETLLGHPAIKRVLISDERPGGPEDLKRWLPDLERRYGQIADTKPTSVVLYWNPDSLAFYKAVKPYADYLQIDYYPHPKNAKLPVAAISDIGDTLWQTAGPNGVYVLQAFGWDPKAHPEGKGLGYKKKSPPPTAGQMVADAKMAVEGHGRGGAMNLSFYALGDPNQASLDSIAEAVRQIRAASWWQNRGK